MHRYARSGTERDFRVIYGRFEPRLRCFVRRRIAEQDVGDLMQHTFERIVRCRGQFRRKFVAWAFRIASNALADHATLCARFRLIDGDDLIPLVGGVSPGNPAVAAQINQLLVWHLNHMRRDHADAFTLLRVEKLSREEAARQLDVRLATLDVWLNRATARLEEALRPYRETE